MMFEFLTLFASFERELQNIKSEVRYITPPKLTKRHLGKKILCHRPMRRGSPKMSIEFTNGKVIANSYGFGGSGWTLIPGVAPYVNDLLENSEHAKDLTKDTPIAIVGAGAAGLFAAYDLLKRGYKNIRIIAEKFDHLASHNAGGLVAPVSMDNAPELQDLINKIGINTYKFYERIIRKQHPDFKEGAVFFLLIGKRVKNQV